MGRLSLPERYVLLGLRLGRHVDGLVDAYFGPPGPAERVAVEEPLAPRALAEEAALLQSQLPDGWLGDQLAGLQTVARVLAGEAIGYADEVERCYGVRPVVTPDDAFAEAHASLDELLPGRGPLVERRAEWQRRHTVPPGQLLPALHDVVAYLRELAAAAFGLPVGESVVLEAMHDRPWWAFNYYRGNGTSRVVVNADIPTTGPDLVGLAAHEAYPGHHLEHAWKEQLLVRERGLVEESIFLVPTPQAVVNEGIAVLGETFLLDEPARADLQSLLARHDVHYDAELAWQLEVALEPLRSVRVNAALQLHEEGRPAAEVQSYIERWALRGPDQAAQSLRFISDPTWRAYAITYSAGRDLCRAYVGDDPARFRTLLTEQVRVRDLRREPPS